MSNRCFPRRRRQKLQKSRAKQTSTLTSLCLRLSLLQLCYVGGANPAHPPEELAAPLGVENPPMRFGICAGTPSSPRQFASTI
ncbi:MAG: hypothetical protein KME32_02405 [Mojavia pulchra JT2-VF2]|uniref:Uncharacterized protein n=1 Tax=Mojavia pulchra JT2-VF2 TaxID=287848 RepID=A0A951PUA9_9NOST|nr:hypothetical protein [Mojavia pulchra JT2-VF2]